MIKIEDLWFSYFGSKEPVLKGIDLEIKKGEFILLTGPTGCGKSTLLKCLNGIIPHESSGEMRGRVHIHGIETKNSSMKELSQHVSLVFQSPDDQIFSTDVEDEVAFGPENLCLTKDEIEKRIEHSLKIVGMLEHRHSATNALSGGQKQRVCIASVLAMLPSLLLLDEPISQMDPKGAEEVLGVIKQLNQELKLTIVMVEHRIHEVSHLVDKIVIMNNGKIVLHDSPRKAFKNIGLFHELGLRVPETVELFQRLGYDEIPLTIEEAMKKIQMRKIDRKTHISNHNHASSEKPVASAKDVWYGYEKDNMVLKGVSLDICKDERVALMGNNGSGKSTLLLHFAAMLKPVKGEVKIFGASTKSMNPYSLAGKVGIVFQNPDIMLFCDTVRDESGFGPKNLGYTFDEINLRVSKALEAMTIEALSDEAPHALSKGQRLRTAVASVLSTTPELMLLDEPTTGQDKVHIEEMMEQFLNDKKTLVFCTHDIETALKYSTRVVVMNDGKILADGSPREVFLKQQILEQASLKQPPVLQISQKLGFAAFSV
ncbi:MAG: energy-coupling factor transporter ATPase, partial [Candidatus Methanoperedens sp.]|nr:energy-coupling factor transporter ATPase [Candidatus Methanoperedens sp.]